MPVVPPACQNTTRWPSNAPRPDAVDEPGQRLRGVDRIDQDALGPGEEAGGRVGGSGGSAVAGAQLVVIEPDRVVGDGAEPIQPIECAERVDHRHDAWRAAHRAA